MKTFAFTLVAFFALAFGVFATESEPAPATVDRLPGVAFAEGVSQITGTAISPMLGVSASGAWRYYRTPDHLRAKLPWYCHPAAWGIGFGVLALCFLKDTFGTAAPSIVKKPLDMAELFENKFSALVASAAFVPLVAAQMAEHWDAAPVEIAALPAGVHLASVFPAAISLDLRWLLIPFSVIGFILVWMTSHAINVLIALSPFTILDALLKLFRAAILSVLAASALISPFLGMVLSLAILAAAMYLAPKAFRLTVFGTLFAMDVLLPSRGRRLATPERAHGFMARPAVGIPARTYGRLALAPDGAVCFLYRPWIVLPERAVPLPPGTLAVAKGVLYPSLLQVEPGDAPARPVVIFLPRYRTHEETIAGHFSIVDVRESSLVRGLRAARAWVAEILRPGRFRPERAGSRATAG